MFSLLGFLKQIKIFSVNFFCFKKFKISHFKSFLTALFKALISKLSPNQLSRKNNFWRIKILSRLFIFCTLLTLHQFSFKSLPSIHFYEISLQKHITKVIEHYANVNAALFNFLELN